MQLLSSYAAIWPELVVVLGALALLMWGAFRPETEGEAEVVGWLAILVLAIAGWLIDAWLTRQGK